MRAPFSLWIVRWGCCPGFTASAARVEELAARLGARCPSPRPPSCCC
ncbi:MAG: hypothetical protein U0232_00910 [Thermomicrobiales bacterium]